MDWTTRVRSSLSQVSGILKREQLIVDTLNRGVSVVEIAARIGVGEKRMRAIIREILARRMPAPPEEFLAIQVSRLNEALLVAFSAMAPTNVKAVDRVVRIVRELDRYHGFFAAERRLPKAPRLHAPVEGSVAFGRALICHANIAPQGYEEIAFAPGIAAAPEATDTGERTASTGEPRPPCGGGTGWGGVALTSHLAGEGRQIFRFGATPLLNPPPQGGRKPRFGRRAWNQAAARSV